MTIYAYNKQTLSLPLHNLFKDIDHHNKFSINIFRGNAGDIYFENLANLYAPKTLLACRTHDNLNEPIPGVKDLSGAWDTRGHCNRLIQINEEALGIFHKLLEDKASPISETRLPPVHSKELLNVIDKINFSDKWISERNENYFSTEFMP